MNARLVWIPRLMCLLCMGIAVFSACKGSTGPPGLVSPGEVSGKIRVWEDALFNSENSPTDISANGFTVTVVGDSTRSGATAPDGSYTIGDVPAGTYVIETSKSGYGTMKRYNFFVGGGESFHSGDIGRNGPKPNTVSAEVDSLTDTGGNTIAGIEVAWSITPPSLQFTTFAYHITFQSSAVGATVDLLGSGALADTAFIFGLPPGSYAVGVQGDIGFGYIDESSGETVFPSRSAVTAAPNNVTLTRPVVVDYSTKKLDKVFPGRRVALAKLVE